MRWSASRTRASMLPKEPPEFSSAAAGRMQPTHRIDGFSTFGSNQSLKKLSNGGVDPDNGLDGITTPAIYELNGENGIQDLVELAGGFNSNSDLSGIRLERFLTGGTTAYNFDFSSLTVSGDISIFVISPSPLSVTFTELILALPGDRHLLIISCNYYYSYTHSIEEQITKVEHTFETTVHEINQQNIFSKKALDIFTNILSNIVERRKALNITCINCKKV